MSQSRLRVVPRELPERREVPNNLPAQPTSLIGRDEDVESALQLLRQPEVRVLTMTGPGGVGKTRLALQVAEELLEEFPDGVYFVELAPIADPDLVIPAIAGALQIIEAPGTPLIDTLNEYLQDRNSLLVLDNFEQIIQAGSVLQLLLATCPDLKLLVTSRSPLRLRAEREFAVSPLAIPEPRGQVSAAKSAHYGAVELFVQRAGTAHTGFELTDANASAVVEVCRRVDGLPLAIELVAAHTRLLFPQAILARLTHPLRLLKGGPPDAPDRHQTMRDTIEWSYRLLDEGEQRIFRRLSVFVGDFSLRAAEAVCNEAGDISIEVDHPQAIEVLQGLEALVDKNLVRQLEQAEDKDGDRRLGMLETVREYAWEQLVSSGEAETMHRQHAGYYLALAERANPNPATQEGLNWLDWLKPDQDNFRAALRWFLNAEATGPAVDALRLLQALQYFWEQHTQHAELIEWLDRAIAQAGSEAKPLQVWARRRGAIQADRAADYELGGAWVAQALEIARELGDKHEIIECINLQSRVALGMGDYAAAGSLMEEVLATSRELGYDFMVAGTLINLGNVAHNKGDYKRAEGLYREGQIIFTKLGNTIGIMWSLLNLGDTLRYLGRPGEARTDLLEALSLAQQADHPLAADTLAVLGGLVLAETERIPDKSAYQLWQIEQSVRLLGLAATLLERRGSQLEDALQSEFDQTLARARTLLGDEPFNVAWEEGHAMTIDQALELATREYSRGTESSKPRGRGRPRMLAAGGLTNREYEVAALVARGMTNAEIARRLVLSVRTVDMHVANAMQKLGLRKRTELAAWSVRQGINSEPV